MLRHSRARDRRPRPSAKTTAVRLTVGALAAVSMLPVSAAMAAPNPNPHLSQILAEPPSTGYVELASHTPGILEGPFDAGTYASIGGLDMQTTITTLAKDGFIAGFGRAWVQQSPSRVMVEIVVAFTGGSGARLWLQQSQLVDLFRGRVPVREGQRRVPRQHHLRGRRPRQLRGGADARPVQARARVHDPAVGLARRQGAAVHDGRRRRARAASDGVAGGRCGNLVARDDRRASRPPPAERTRASGLERPVVLPVKLPVLA